MPNYCTNTLNVWGDSEQLKEFKEKTMIEKNGEFHFTFDILFPTPKELGEDTTPPEKREGESETDYQKRMKDRKETFGYDNWYDWRIANWGTKWDALETYYSEDKYSEDLILDFETAWSPPVEWLKKVSLKFPNLNFILYYIEEGTFFCGMVKIGDGEIVHEHGEPVYQDDWGNPIHCDEQGIWYDSINGTELSDQNIYPIVINPYRE